MTGLTLCKVGGFFGLWAANPTPTAPRSNPSGAKIPVSSNIPPTVSVNPTSAVVVASATPPTSPSAARLAVAPSAPVPGV